jgi:mono/diheme cytochrome c family protein
MRALWTTLILAPFLLAACSEDDASRRATGQIPAGNGVGIVTNAEGRLLYAEYCLMCHGKTGAGDGLMADGLPYRPRDLALDLRYINPSLPEAEGLVELIKVGIPERGMPGYETQLTDEQARAIAEHVVALRAGRE